MSKKRSNTGFTLVELMVALILFATLGVVGFNFLKSSMNATLKQRTQQAANENAKTILKIITNDLKSSTVMNYKIPYNSSGTQSYSYPSSVIFPAINQFSTTGINSAEYKDKVEAVMSFSHTSGFSGIDTMESNQNRIVFYARDMLNNTSTTNVEIQVIEYKTIFENGKCRVDRIDYNAYNSTNNLTEWPGIDLIATGDGTYSIDGRDVEFNSALFRGFNSRQRINNTLLSLPNRGDVVLLYLNRAFDDTEGVDKRKFAANQYNLKVMVFQTMKDIDYDVVNKVTDDNGDAIYRVNRNFTNLFKTESESTDSESINITRKQRRDNYRYAELSSSIGVFAPSSN